MFWLKYGGIAYRRLLTGQEQQVLFLLGFFWLKQSDTTIFFVGRTLVESSDTLLSGASGR